MSSTLSPEKTASSFMPVISHEGAEATGDSASDHHRVDLSRALVGVQRLGVGDEAPDVVVEDDAVTAEQLARPSDGFSHADGAIDLRKRRLLIKKDALVLLLSESDHHPEARGRVAEHLDEQ